MDWVTASSIRRVSAPGSYCSRINHYRKTVLATIDKYGPTCIFCGTEALRRVFWKIKDAEKKYNLTH